MENEQEGIDLGTINSGGDSITLPEVDEVQENNIATEQTTVVDEEKESLKRSLNAERRARKEAEKKNKEFEARLSALEDASKAQEKTTLDELIESGVEESIAKSIAGAIDKKQSGSKKLEKELADMKFKNELLEKSKENSFNDIVEFEDEIKPLVDKGLSIEQAYYAVSYNKTANSNSEITRKVEAKIQNNQARKEILGNINSNAGGAVENTTPKVKATATEYALAKVAGMDINDYLAAKNADSIKQYNEYNKKKVK